jgi:N-acetylglucosamine-6-phosphate deacetylase
MTHKGFVDIQVNGYLGVDFSSPALQPDDICRVTGALVEAGTVGYCATLITSPAEVYDRNLPLIAKAMDVPGVRGHLMGIHLEGPFLSPEEGARGAHQARWMRRPDRDYFRELQDRAQGEIKMLTLAPELEGAIDLIDHVRKKYDTSISLGHHLAGRNIIRDAVAAGASLITHLGNGCPNLIHRHANPILHQLATDRLCAGLITDGQHIPEDFIRVVFKCKGVDGVYVVSDSAPIAGLQPGIYTNMGIQVRLTLSGRIEQLDAPYLAGSACTMAQCMRFLRSLQFLSEDELWQVGYENPLRILGRPEACLAITDLPDFHW